MCVARAEPFLIHGRNSEPVGVSVTGEEKKEHTLLPQAEFQQNPGMLSKWVGFSYLALSLQRAHSLTMADKQGPAVFINPWMASATLAQSLELTFSPKATSSLCLERDYLSTRPNWPLSQGTFTIWQWRKEMASITKHPLLSHLLNRKLSGDPKISLYHCGNAWDAPAINLRSFLWAYTQRAGDALY